MTSERFDRKFSQWQNALLDLTRRNRLLRHTESPSASLRIVRPTPEEIFQRLVIDDKPWRIYADDPDDTSQTSGRGRKKPVAAAERTADADVPLAPDELLSHRRGEKAESALKILERSLREGLDDQGVHVLYLSFGMMQWTGDDGKDWRAPLLLVPVTLFRKSIRDPFRLALAEDEPRINPALAEQLRLSMGIRLPGLPDELSAQTPETFAVAVQRHFVGKKPSDVAVDPVAVWLDRFDFAKIAMYQDLTDNRPIFAEHPIVRALAGDLSALAPLAPTAPELAELDDAVPPEQTFHVLDADSSQHRAIEIVKHGGNLVLEGPPGTGKSQTISNMIAELMALGKRVLFVSEKRAALEVVWRRLEQVGVGRFCLDLHNPQQVNKKTVAQDLFRVWRDPGDPPTAPKLDMRQISRLRFILASYVRALHEPIFALNVSPFEGYEHFWRHADAPNLRFFVHDVASMTAERLRMVDEAAEKLSDLLHVAQNPDGHLWSFVREREITLTFREMVEAEFSRMATAADALQRWCEQARENFHQPGREIFPDAAATADLIAWLASREYPPPTPKWFVQPDLRAVIDTVAEARDRSQRIAQNQPILTRYTEAFLEADLSALEQRARERGGGVWRWLSPGYWRDRRIMKSYLQPQARFSPGTMAADCLAARQLRDDRQWFAERKALLIEQVGPIFDRPESAFSSAAKMLGWIGKFRHAHPGAMISETMVQKLTDPAQSSHWRRFGEQGNAIVAEWETALDAVKTRFPKLAADDFVRWDLHDVRDWFAQRVASLGAISDWVAYKRVADAVRDLGVPDLIAVLQNSTLANDHVVPAVRKRFWRLWLDAAQTAADPLATFRGAEHQHMIARFCDADSRLPRTGAKRVFEKLLALRPVGVGYAPPGSEMQVLAHQASLKRGHMSVRRLLSRIPRLAQTLKPCWMMSPLTVSQYLTAEHRFDVVIFDEASQIKPEDAVPAIRHGQQVVIVGDRQQMPPTSFFSRMASEYENLSDDDDDAELLAPLESVLEEAAQFFPSHRLTWHYRSKDESLIAFSNRAFYDGDLITFPAPRVPDPSPTSSPPKTPPATPPEAPPETPDDAVPDAMPDAAMDTAIVTAEWADEPPPSQAESGPESRRVEGGEIVEPPLGIRLLQLPRGQSGYVKGRNKPEAELVAKTVVEFVRAHPHYSLGVVAFGVAQQRLIEDLLDDARKRDPALDARFNADLDEPIFVKNLETVQGDERDVIVFSTTYGPDAAGNLRLNFGPIQNLGGERRLNVAFTRARFQVILVTALKSLDIDPKRATSVGANRLREYLEFAEHGGQFAFRRSDHGSRESAGKADPEQGVAMTAKLAEHLRVRGYDVRLGVGEGPYRVDLAVVHPRFPNQFLLGIVTDGPAYRACPTVRDRDRTRPEILSHLGWNLLPVWARDRFEHAETVAESIVAKLRELESAPVNLPRPAPRTWVIAPRSDNTAGDTDADSGDAKDSAKTAPAAESVTASAALAERQSSARPVSAELAKAFPVYEVAPLHSRTAGKVQDLPLATLAEIVKTIVETEGPVHRELVIERIKNAWKTRRTKNFVMAIDQGISLAKGKKWVRSDGDFLWPAKRDTARPRVPADGSEPRDVEFVALIEIELMMAEIVAMTMSLPREELVQLTMQTLGFSRFTPKIEARLADALKHALASGRLLESAEGFLIRGTTT